MRSRTMTLKRFRYNADNVLLRNNSNNCLSVMDRDRLFENEIIL